MLHGGDGKVRKKEDFNKEFVSKLKNKFKLKKIINYYGLVEQIGSFSSNVKIVIDLLLLNFQTL